MKIKIRIAIVDLNRSERSGTLFCSSEKKWKKYIKTSSFLNDFRSILMFFLSKSINGSKEIDPFNNSSHFLINFQCRIGLRPFYFIFIDPFKSLYKPTHLKSSQYVEINHDCICSDGSENWPCHSSWQRGKEHVFIIHWLCKITQISGNIEWISIPSRHCRPMQTPRIQASSKLLSRMFGIISHSFLVFHYCLFSS